MQVDSESRNEQVLSGSHEGILEENRSKMIQSTSGMNFSSAMLGPLVLVC